MIGYSTHGYITSLANVKELSLLQGSSWFDDSALDGEKSRAVWVTLKPEDALRHLFPASIHELPETSIEKKQYQMALLAPENYVEKMELSPDWQEVLQDGQGGHLYILPVGRTIEPSPLGMLAEMEVHEVQPDLSDEASAKSEIGKMVKPMSLVSYLGGKKKWIEVFEQDLLPLLHTRIKQPYAFLDAFGGSGIVSYTFRMGDYGSDVRKVYYNDVNDNMVNLLKAVKNKTQEMYDIHQELISIFSKDPTQKGFQALKAISENDPSIARRAVAYVMRMKASYMGKGANIPKQAERIEGSVRKAIHALDSLDSWHEAFKDTTILHGSFDEAIEKFEREQKAPRVIFCDPPYIGHKASEQYEAAFDHSLHQRLVDMIAGRTSTFVLTHSINPEFTAIYGPVLKTRDFNLDVDVRYGNRGDHERQHETLSVWFAKR